MASARRLLQFYACFSYIGIDTNIYSQDECMQSELLGFTPSNDILVVHLTPEQRARAEGGLRDVFIKGLSMEREAAIKVAARYICMCVYMHCKTLYVILRSKFDASPVLHVYMHASMYIALTYSFICMQVDVLNRRHL
jgi:hypothetical protein